MQAVGCRTVEQHARRRGLDPGVEDTALPVHQQPDHHLAAGAFEGGLTSGGVLLVGIQLVAQALEVAALQRLAVDFRWRRWRGRGRCSGDHGLGSRLGLDRFLCRFGRHRLWLGHRFRLGLGLRFWFGLWHRLGRWRRWRGLGLLVLDHRRWWLLLNHRLGFGLRLDRRQLDRRLVVHRLDLQRLGLDAHGNQHQRHDGRDAAQPLTDSKQDVHGQDLRVAMETDVKPPRRKVSMTSTRRATSTPLSLLTMIVDLVSGFSAALSADTSASTAMSLPSSCNWPASPRVRMNLFCGLSCCELLALGNCVFMPSAGITFRLTSTKNTNRNIITSIMGINSMCALRFLGSSQV